MSIQYKCERCGKASAVEYADKRPIMPESWMRIALIQKETRHVDICPDCIESMIGFIGKAEIGAQLVTTKIDLDEVISSAVHHAFSVSKNNARKPKEFFASFPWLDEIDKNDDHYKYMFCEDWVQYWGFIRVLYSSVADSVAKWCYAKRNDLSWVDWDSDDFEKDRDLIDQKKTEPKRKDNPIDERCPEPNCTREKDHLGKCLDKDGNMWFNPELGKPSTGDEADDKPEPEAEPEPETDDPGSCPTYWEGKPCLLPKGHSGDHSYAIDEKPSGAVPDESRPLEYFVYCDRVIDGRQCILHKGHKGDCLLTCDDPNCPGYSWVATADRPHPTTTCKASHDPKTQKD